MIRTVVASTFALALAWVPMAQAQDLAFPLSNDTSVTLMELYMSPSNVDVWEEDMLGTSVLGAGETADVVIADGRSDCIYDIRGVLADGDVVEDWGVDLCDLGSYAFIED